MKVTSELAIYEIDGVETKGVDRPKVIVTNHWNLRAFVLLNVEGKVVAVEAAELKRAIDNAQNARS